MGDSADVWLAAVPQRDGRLTIHLYYSSVNIPHERMRWTADALEAVLSKPPVVWTRTMDQVTSDIGDVSALG